LVQQVLQAALPSGTGDGSGTIASFFTVTNLTTLAGDGTLATATTRANFGPIFDAYTALDKMRILLSRWRVRPTDPPGLRRARHTRCGWCSTPRPAAGAHCTRCPPTLPPCQARQSRSRR